MIFKALLFLIFLLGEVVELRAQMRTWDVRDADEFAIAVLEGVQVHPDSLVILASLIGEENLALGMTVLDDFGRDVALSDGSIEAPASEWNSATPQVFGRSFTVDLGLDRAIHRVRVLAGETAVSIRPEYFMRGYRIEAASQIKRDSWRTLAEQRENFVLNVDTQKDSTWLNVDEGGAAIASLGRFVRLTLIRQDKSNWVVLGEMEVFGRGYGSKGMVTGEFSAPEPVNIGKMRWQSQIPPQTQLGLQFRGNSGAAAGPGWDNLPVYQTPGSLFSGAEPVSQFNYRALLESSVPFVTPALKAIEVDYDPILVAREVLGSVRADEVLIGEWAALQYRGSIQLESADYGIDLVSLAGAPVEVEEVLFEGAALSFEKILEPQGQSLIQLAPGDRISSSGTLEILGQGLFLLERTALQLRVGSREQQERDGYINWQNAHEDPMASWTVRAGGAPAGLLGKVEFSPRPFSPVDAGRMEFRFVVGHLREQTEVALLIFTLDGIRVRELVQTGGGGQYLMYWNGRDQQNRLVEPGLYLFEVRLQVGDSTSSRRGAFVVAY